MVLAIAYGDTTSTSCSGRGIGGLIFDAGVADLGLHPFEYALSTSRMGETTVNWFMIEPPTGSVGTSAPYVQFRGVVEDALSRLRFAATRFIVNTIGNIATDSPDDRPLSTLKRTLVQLESFRALQPDWDTYGAKPISDKAILTARAILFYVFDRLGQICGEAIDLYDTLPVPHGGVGLEWRGPGGHLTIEIEENGNIGYLLVRGSKDRPEYAEGDGIRFLDVLRLVTQTVLPAPQNRQWKL